MKEQRALSSCCHTSDFYQEGNVESFDHHIPWGMTEDRTTKNTQLIKGTLQTTSELAPGDSDVCS